MRSFQQKIEQFCIRKEAIYQRKLVKQKRMNIFIVSFEILFEREIKQAQKQSTRLKIIQRKWWQRGDIKMIFQNFLLAPYQYCQGRDKFYYELSSMDQFIIIYPIYQYNNIEMTTPNSCLICKHPLEKWNRQFYCCNRNERYCIVCRGSTCRHCGKIIGKQFVSPRCKQCLISSNSDNDMIYEPICDKYYCSKCIITRIIKRNRQGSNYIFPCGHPVNAELVDDFIRGRYCIICGRACDSMADYDLLNGQKCCNACVRWQKNKVQPYLLICLSCGNILRNVNEVGNWSEGLIVCGKCVKQSQISEGVCQKANEQKKIQQKRMEQKLKNMKLQDTSSSINDNSDHSHNSGEAAKKSPTNKHPDYQVKITYTDRPDQIRSIDSPVKKVKSPPKKSSDVGNMKSPPKSPKAATKLNVENSNNLFQTFSPGTKGDIRQVQSILQIQPITNKIEISSPLKPVGTDIYQSSNSMVSSKKSNDSDNLRKTILQSFPSEKQEQQENNLPKSRMKKHMSMDTFVEKMKITIQKEKSRIVTCNECQYDIPEEESFEIQNVQKQSKKYCKLCYTLLTNSQSFGFSIQQTLRPELDASRNRRGASNQKLSLTANSYNLLNSPYQMKNSTIESNQNQMKLSATNFDHYHKITANIRVSDNKHIYREECSNCKKVGSSIVRTSDRGLLCIACYQKLR